MQFSWQNGEVRYLKRFSVQLDGNSDKSVNIYSDSIKKEVTNVTSLIVFYYASI